LKLLVTGCCGFIGSHFVKHAIKLGHEVIGIDLLTYAGRSKNIPELNRGLLDGGRLLVGDICDAEFVHAVVDWHQPDAVIHLAAESHVARSIESRDEFLRTNVMGTNTLLEACLKYWRGGIPLEIGGEFPVVSQFRFLYVSTDEVYGSLQPNEPPWTELSPYAPNNAYAASKAAGDHLVRAYHKTYGLPTIITHSANNYGTRQHPEKLIPTLIRQLMHNESMTLHGDGMNIRDWLHVSDHCRGLMAALTYGRPGTVYNFGGECERTNLRIATTIARVMSKSANIEMMLDRAGNDARYATNNSHVRQALGWEPGPSIEHRIADVVQWYINNPDYGDEYGS